MSNLRVNDLSEGKLVEKARQAEHALLCFRGRSAASFSREELIRMNAALAILAAASSRGFRGNPAALGIGGTGGSHDQGLPIEMLS